MILNRYLVRYCPIPKASMRLYCIPYAGAGPRIYREWQNQLPNNVEVIGICLPGREHRLFEPSFLELNPIIVELGPILACDIDRPFVLFGHSMGGLIAYELARYLLDRGIVPEHLVISGCRPPHTREDTLRRFELVQ